MRHATVSVVVAVLMVAGTAMATDYNNDGASNTGKLAEPPSGDVNHNAASSVVSFPSAGDNVSVLFFPFWWNLGDTAWGDRTVPEDPVTQAQISLMLEGTVLSCDVLDMDFLINGTVVGSFEISAADGLGPIIRDFAFPAIAGGTYELRYTVTRTVGAGCGSVEVDFDNSTVALTGPATPVATTTWGKVKAIYN